MFLLLISFLSDNWQVFIRSTRAKISLTVSCAEKCSVRWCSNNHNIRSTFWYDSSSSIVSPFPVCVSFFPFIQQHFQFTLSRHRDTLLLILKSNGSEKTTAHSLYQCTILLLSVMYLYDCSLHRRSTRCRTLFLKYLTLEEHLMDTTRIRLISFRSSVSLF